MSALANSPLGTREALPRDRLRRRLLALVVAAEAAALLALAAAAPVPRGSSPELRRADRALVISLRLTGLALWPEASYCRQPALSDLFTPHAVHPASPDLLPAGSVVPPHPWTGPAFRAPGEGRGDGP